VNLNYKLKELLQEVFKVGLSEVFPNITNALHILVSLPASVASGEHFQCAETG
jgi:hypothetical protein